METNENKIPEQSQEKLYTKDEMETMKANLEAEIKNQESKKTEMSELEKVQAELAEMKRKYQEKEDECIIAREKQETQALLEATGLSSKMLDVVYTEKNMEATKTKIQILKDYIDEIVNSTLQNGTAETSSNVPLTSTVQGKMDPFLEGFLSD